MADAALSVPRFTVEQYLDIERDSSVKHEFVNGLVYAMAGTSNWHNLIALNFISLLNARLPERCRALGMDVQLHIKSQSGAKMLEYRQLAMLEDYVLLRPDTPVIEVFRRSAGWVKQTIEGQGGFRLESLDIEVALTDLYRRIPIVLPPTSGEK